MTGAMMSPRCFCVAFKLHCIPELFDATVDEASHFPRHESPPRLSLAGDRRLVPVTEGQACGSRY